MGVFTPINTNPAGSYDPCWMTTGAGGLNTAIVGNGAIAGANVLNNCVGWSQGCMLKHYCQINDIVTPVTNPFSMFNGDAETWLTIAQNNNFPTGQTPQIGAVGVYYAQQQNVGHVCNIEAYVNGVWEISESHYYYPGGQGSWDYSYLQVNLLPAFIGADPDWQLIGFIYPYGTIPSTGSGGALASIIGSKKKFRRHSGQLIII